MEIKFITERLNKLYIEMMNDKLTYGRHELPEINTFFNMIKRGRAHRESSKIILYKQKNSCFKMATLILQKIN